MHVEKVLMAQHCTLHSVRADEHRRRRADPVKEKAKTPEESVTKLWHIFPHQGGAQELSSSEDFWKTLQFFLEHTNADFFKTLLGIFWNILLGIFGTPHW